MYKHLCGSRQRDRIEQIARRVAAMVIAVPAAPLAISPAMAQQVAQESAASPESIVVTASKRAESLQSAPLSVTALTGEALSEHQVTSLDDYVKLLPSVSYQSFGPGQSQINFRGITTGGDGIVTGPLPTAGVYVDETSVTTIANALDIHVYDMARVEALSGPQGTLYGASSLSGTLRLITNKPVIGKWEGGVDAGGSKYGPGDGGGSLEGFLNVPINDRMALRVVFYGEHKGGYISNTFANRTYQRPVWVDPANPNSVVNDFPLTVNNGKYVDNNFNSVDSAGGRALLKVNLDENWTLTPAVFLQNQLAHGSFLEDPRLGDLQVHDFTRDFNKDNWELASLTLQGKVSDWDLTYNPAYLSRRVDNISDYSYFVVAYDKLAQTVGSLSGYTYLKDSLGHDIDPTQVVHTADHYTKHSHERQQHAVRLLGRRRLPGQFRDREPLRGRGRDRLRQHRQVLSGIGRDPQDRAQMADRSVEDDVLHLLDRVPTGGKQPPGVHHHSHGAQEAGPATLRGRHADQLRNRLEDQLARPPALRQRSDLLGAVEQDPVQRAGDPRHLLHGERRRCPLPRLRDAGALEGHARHHADAQRHLCRCAPDDVVLQPAVRLRSGQWRAVARAGRDAAAGHAQDQAERHGQVQLRRDLTSATTSSSRRSSG
ncbi:MAG: TonB-dependent receptor [Betaproteobacteria bacterium]|nr:MAG: TonB-dependent receptor [Betaproteobacteria bacterium]